MRPSPLQTYLAERLQSARGLGWPMPEQLPAPQETAACSEPAPVFAWPNLLSAWLRVIR